MTQAQREAYYSEAHWMKQYNESFEYRKTIFTRHRKGEISYQRAREILVSVERQMRMFLRYTGIMAGINYARCRGRILKNDLIINGINYDLMLEGARFKTHDLVDSIAKEAKHVAQLSKRVSDTFHASKDWIYDYSRTRNMSLVERLTDGSKTYYPFPGFISYDKGSPDGNKTVISVVGERGREVVDLMPGDTIHTPAITARLLKALSDVNKNIPLKKFKPGYGYGYLDVLKDQAEHEKNCKHC
jgi:hypothetical protein